MPCSGLDGSVTRKEVLQAGMLHGSLDIFRELMTFSRKLVVIIADVFSPNGLKRLQSEKRVAVSLRGAPRGSVAPELSTVLLGPD